MSKSENKSNDVLPYQLDDGHSVGPRKSIIDLSTYSDVDNIYQGRCNFCGYDRGILSSHTEVEGVIITCRECGAVLIKDN